MQDLPLHKLKFRELWNERWRANCQKTHWGWEFYRLSFAKSFLGALTWGHIKQKRLQLLTAVGLLFKKKYISWDSLWKGGRENPFWHSAYKIFSKRHLRLKKFHPLLLLQALLIFYSSLLWLKSHFLKKTDDRQLEWLMILCHRFVFLRGRGLRGWMLV